MKKISIIISLIFISITGALTSCSEDYPGPNPVDVTANYSNKFSNPNSNLSLTYSGENMIGKSVDFSTVKGETANITLYDIIPGEKALRLTSVPLMGDDEGYSFKGEGVGVETEVAFSYEGRVANGILEINLKDIKMENSSLWANNYKFPLFDESGAIAAYVDTEMAPEASSGYNKLLNGVLSYFLPQLLQNVTLETDGDILATYSTDPILLDGVTLDEFSTNAMTHIVFVMNLLAGSITKSDIDKVTTERTYSGIAPRNLAYWYKKGDRMFVKLNLPAVIEQIMKNSGKTVDENLIATLYEAILKVDAIQIRNLLGKINESLDNTFIRLITGMDDNSFRQVFSWITEGIPMHVEVVEGHTHIYVDKETLLPLLNLLPEITPIVIDLLKNSLPANIRDFVIGIVADMLEQWSTDWPASQRFNIGLDLVPDTSEQ